MLKPRTGTPYKFEYGTVTSRSSVSSKTCYAVHYTCTALYRRFYRWRFLRRFLVFFFLGFMLLVQAIFAVFYLCLLIFGVNVIPIRLDKLPLFMRNHESYLCDLAWKHRNTGLSKSYITVSCNIIPYRSLSCVYLKPGMLMIILTVKLARAMSLHTMEYGDII